MGLAGFLVHKIAERFRILKRPSVFTIALSFGLASGVSCIDWAKILERPFQKVIGWYFKISRPIRQPL